MNKQQHIEKPKSGVVTQIKPNRPSSAVCKQQLLNTSDITHNKNKKEQLEEPPSIWQLGRFHAAESSPKSSQRKKFFGRVNTSLQVPPGLRKSVMNSPRKRHRTKSSQSRNSRLPKIIRERIHGGFEITKENNLSPKSLLGKIQRPPMYSQRPIKLPPFIEAQQSVKGFRATLGSPRADLYFEELSKSYEQKPTPSQLHSVLGNTSRNFYPRSRTQKAHRRYQDNPSIFSAKNESSVEHIAEESSLYQSGSHFYYDYTYGFTTERERELTRLIKARLQKDLQVRSQKVKLRKIREYNQAELVRKRRNRIQLKLNKIKLQFSGEEEGQEKTLEGSLEAVKGTSDVRKVIEFNEVGELLNFIKNRAKNGQDQQELSYYYVDGNGEERLIEELLGEEGRRLDAVNKRLVETLKIYPFKVVRTLSEKHKKMQDYYNRDLDHQGAGKSLSLHKQLRYDLMTKANISRKVLEKFQFKGKDPQKVDQILGMLSDKGQLFSSILKKKRRMAAHKANLEKKAKKKAEKAAKKKSALKPEDQLILVKESVERVLKRKLNLKSPTKKNLTKGKNQKKDLKSKPYSPKSSQDEDQQSYQEEEYKPQYRSVKFEEYAEAELKKSEKKNLSTAKKNTNNLRRYDFAKRQLTNKDFLKTQNEQEKGFVTRKNEKYDKDRMRRLRLVLESRNVHKRTSRKRNRRKVYSRGLRSKGGRYSKKDYISPENILNGWGRGTEMIYGIQIGSSSEELSKLNYARYAKEA